MQVTLVLDEGAFWVGGEDGAGYGLTYPQPPLGGRRRAHNNKQHNRDSYMDMDKKQ